MRVVHTSDWHLGQELYGFDRSVEQESFLDWLADQVESLAADALVVTGDVFDAVNPPVPAQRRLYRFLHRVTDSMPALQIVIVAGNHDSAARIELPAPLLDAERVTLVGGIPRVNGTLEPARALTTLRDNSGRARVLCAALPYLRPGDLPAVPQGECAVRALYALVFDAAQAVRGRLPLLFTGHLHVQGGQVSELSERRIMVGGEAAVSAEIFPASVDYVALGHLHRPQTVGGKEHVRYAGAPFPMSVAERDYRHSVVLVEFGETSVGEIRTIDIPRAVPFLRIPGVRAVSLEEVETLLGDLDLPDPGPDRRPFVEVAVRLNGPQPDLRSRIDAALEGKPVRLTRVVREVAGEEGGNRALTEAEITVEGLRPEDVFARCHEKQYGSPPPVELLRAFEDILAEVQNPDDGGDR